MDQTITDGTQRALEIAEQAQQSGEANYFAPKKVGPDTLDLWQRIEQFGLQPYIGELDVKGYTVVPPEVALTEEIHPRVLEKVLDVAERRTGTRPDMDPSHFTEMKSGFGLPLSYVMFEDDIFPELLMNPVLLTFLTYLLGENAVLSSMQAQVKGKGPELPVHCDMVTMTAPFAPHHQLCNITLNLTRYGEGDGPICFIPGSHKLYRHVTPGEADDQRVAAEAEPGSFIIFAGNTWHGAYARTNPGLRANMLMQFVRPHVRSFEAYREDVTEEMLKRYPPRFTKLMGHHTNFGWREDGPSNETTAYGMGAHAYD